jgi:hypothetical protein
MAASRLKHLIMGLFFLGTPAVAQEYIEVQGPVSDEDFYRVVACAAPPGGACAKDFLHWKTERPLRVSLVRVDRAFMGGRRKRAEAAITRALQYINRVGSAVQLEQVRDPKLADITIFLIDTDGSAPIEGTGVKGIDGTTVGGARVTVWSNSETNEIHRAVVVFSTRLHISHYESAMIEEITQALGLLTDIRTPVYEGVSVFSQDSNAAKDFGPQDIYTLLRHYPPQE